LQTDRSDPGQFAKSRKSKFHLSIEEYKNSSVLKTDITAVAVSNLVTAIAGQGFAKTTGA
jgi:hypothetical protein